MKTSSEDERFKTKIHCCLGPKLKFKHEIVNLSKLMRPQIDCACPSACGRGCELASLSGVCVFECLCVCVFD